MKTIIAVDSGKYATKAMRKLEDGTVKNVIFRTKMDTTEETATSAISSFVVEFEGKKYLVGNTAETVDFDTTKAKEIHRIATYTAAALLIEENENPVITLAIGCPLSIFVNVDAREKYKQYFFDKKNIMLKINGDLRNFIIDDIVICPESSGIIFKNQGEYSNKLVGVIDIGGLNTNCCVYSNLSPIKTTSFTTNLGGNIMQNELKLLINSTFVDCNIQDWQMEQIIHDGYIKKYKTESAKLITSFLSKHLNSILIECKKKSWDLDNLDLVFVGGGCNILKKEIVATLPDAVISGSGQVDNVEGFYIVGELNGR